MRSIANRFFHWLDHEAHKTVMRLLTMMLILVLSAVLFLIGAMIFIMASDTVSKL
jgi:hypothetical protein